jgi:probable rRNA maturation factor
MPAFSISIANRQRTLRFDRRRLLRLARSVLRQEQVAAAEISVAILDDAAIHAINRQFLNHDYPTDVISFLLDCSLADARPPLERPHSVRRGAAKVIEGEIVISAETAIRIAARFGIRPQNELALYLAHGLLHLCGYDDRTPKEKRLMRRREAEALEDMGTR